MTGTPITPFLHLPGGGDDLTPPLQRGYRTQAPKEYEERDSGMIDGIKSRKLTYVDEAGNEGPVLLSLESRGTKRTDLGDSAFLDEVVGAIRIESEPITYTIELTGEDEIQLIFRLLWMADIYVQTRFRSQGYDIYKRELGDVTRESGIYN